MNHVHQSGVAKAMREGQEKHYLLHSASQQGVLSFLMVQMRCRPPTWMDGWNLLQSTGRQKWHKRPPLQPMGFTPGGPSYHDHLDSIPFQLRKEDLRPWGFSLMLVHRAEHRMGEKGALLCYSTARKNRRPANICASGAEGTTNRASEQADTESDKEAGRLTH